MKHIVVAGGGPAGFMAAVTAAERTRGTAAVEILDAGEPLSTLLRTGGGRCNLTNAAERDHRKLAACYPRGGKFLLSVFSRFDPEAAMEWFRSRGLALATEEGGRVFPASRRAADARQFFLSLAKKLGITVTGGSSLLEIHADKGGFLLSTSRGDLFSDTLIMAMGGKWRDPESPGYRIARSFGHAVTPLAPALSALVALEEWPGNLSGLTLGGARVRVKFEGRTVADERGDLLFTHRGISGPAAFRVSSRSAFLPFSPASPLLASISASPEETPETISRALSGFGSSRPKQAVLTCLRTWVPRSLAKTILELAGVDPDTKCGQLKREDRETLTRLINAIPLSIVSRDPEGEIVTAGGVDLDGVDPKTMESKTVPGLFFCGEILDIDGFTGGFNLQACWSTGHLAGLGAAAVLGGI